MPEEPRSTEERLLRQAAEAFPYPATPALGARVVAGLDAPPAPRQPRPLVPALVAVAGLALAALVAMLAVRDVREAVADFLGLAVEGERIEVLPPPPPGTTPTPLPTPTDLQAYATPVALREVEVALGFAPNLPPGRGQPSAVYRTDFQGGRVLILDYPAFDLWESRDAFFEKFVFSKSAAKEPVETVVNGRPAYWIEGGGHILRFIGPDGREIAGSQRTVVGNTLVWRGEFLGYRLEVETMSREDAIRLAESLP